MKLNQETIDFLTKLLENNNLATKVAEDLREMIAQKQTQAVFVEENPTYLKKIFSKEKIFVGGDVAVKSAKEVFNGYLSPAFANVCGSQIPQREIATFKQVTDGTFENVFLSLNKDKKALAMTKEEIVDYCDKHKDKLRTDGYGTFFVYEEDDNFFVANVRFDDLGLLYLDVYDFSYIGVWVAECAHIFVAPATALVALAP